MLTETDRQQIMYIIKKCLDSVGLNLPTLPVGIIGDKEFDIDKLSDERFSNVVDAIKV